VLRLTRVFRARARDPTKSQLTRGQH